MYMRERFGLDKYFAIGVAIGVGVIGGCIALVVGVIRMFGGGA